MAQIVEFAGNHPLLIVAAGVLIAVIIVNELRARLRGVAELSPAATVAQMNRGALVLDARAPELFEQGHIINAANAPLDSLADRLDALRKKHSGKPVVTYCGNGASGARAAQLMRKHGFDPVFNLRGGLTAWQRENLPVTTQRSGVQAKRKRRQ